MLTIMTGSHPRISPEEAIRERDAEVEIHYAQDVHLHLEQLAERVRAITDV